MFNHTRHAALDRVVAEARADRANAVVGIRTVIQPWAGMHEMMMSGTAAFNPALPSSAIANPVTSDLTGEELWAMTSLGYAPGQTADVDLDLFARHRRRLPGRRSSRSQRGEISELTRLIHDAREVAIDRLKSEADALGVEEVVGVKTYIAEIGNGLVEFMAIGTAVKPTPGVQVASTRRCRRRRSCATGTPGSTAISAFRSTERASWNRPHPNPLPQAGEGAPRSLESLLPLAGEGGAQRRMRGCRDSS